ncbi:MAG: hypothetical protein R3F55_22470 [Alphaproteobacteria bacterium]
MHKTKARRLPAATLATTALAGLTLLGAGGLVQDGGLIPAAFAQQQQQHGAGGQGGAGGSGGAGGGGYGRSDATQELQDLLRQGGRGGLSTEADEDSDRPAWAQGNRDLNPHAQGGGQPAGAGTSRGDLYGDLYVILRDANGVPILLTLPSGDQVVQPLDADGNLIPLDAEGEPLDATLLQEVDFGRLSVGRAPTQVLNHSLSEALTSLASIYTLDENNDIVIADGASITFDAAGRLVITVDGESKTIDSPLENLALYADLMATGAINTVVTFSYVDENNETIYVTKEVSFVPTLDLDVAASLLAAAADKTGGISVDLVAYENSILDVNTVVDGQTVAYFDYSSFTYDRADAYAGDTITYLEPTTDSDGNTVYTVVTKSVLDAVFGGDDGVFDPTTENVSDTNISGFAVASDDALQVIEFVHDHQIPEN